MLPPRIHGTEMEYSSYVQYTAGGIESIPSASMLSRVVDDYLPPGISGINDFYSNGSRIYVDIGDHLEYATPEDTSFIGTVANEIAGEQLLMSAFSAAREAEEFQEFVINKRVVDYGGKTWGYHENYMVAADEVAINPGSLSLLGIHLATRNIFCGAGAVANLHSGGANFMISQKNSRLNHDYHVGTTKDFKPLVNLRDEPLADRSRWRRIHVTSGDPNMSPWATYLKLGTTSLVLRLAEQQVDLAHLYSASLCRVARQVSCDTSLRHPIYLNNGLFMTAAEVQTDLCDAVSNLAERVELPVEEQKVLSSWQSACDLARNDPETLTEKTDWGAKLRLLERYREKHGLSWASPRIAVLDWRWDRLSSTGLAMKLRDSTRNGSWSGAMPEPELVIERMFKPPATTRAKLRGEFITRAMIHLDSRYINVNWGQVTLGEVTANLEDPYATESLQFSRLMDYLADLPVITPALSDESTTEVEDGRL